MRRPRLKPVRDRDPVAVGIAGLLALTLLGGLAYGADRLPFTGGTDYNADFTEAAGLDEGDEVRIAGVKVGKVTGVALDGPKVKVSFTVEDAWIGDRSTAAIAVKTVLGDKYLAVDPLGSRPQDPGSRIPSSRTTSPTTSPRPSRTSAAPSTPSTPAGSRRASRPSPTPSRTHRPM